MIASAQETIRARARLHVVKLLTPFLEAQAHASLDQEYFVDELYDRLPFGVSLTPAFQGISTCSDSNTYVEMQIRAQIGKPS